MGASVNGLVTSVRMTAIGQLKRYFNHRSAITQEIITAMNCNPTLGVKPQTMPQQQVRARTSALSLLRTTGFKNRRLNSRPK